MLLLAIYEYNFALISVLFIIHYPITCVFSFPSADPQDALQSPLCSLNPPPSLPSPLC